jgi:hypothetical protein
LHAAIKTFGVFTRRPEQIKEDADDSTKAYAQYAAGGRRSLTRRCDGYPR